MNYQKQEAAQIFIDSLKKPLSGQHQSRIDFMSLEGISIMAREKVMVLGVLPVAFNKEVAFLSTQYEGFDDLMIFDRRYQAPIEEALELAQKDLEEKIAPKHDYDD